MPSTQVPVNTVVDPSDLQQTVVTLSQVSAINDVQGQASTAPPPRVISTRIGIIRR